MTRPTFLFLSCALSIVLTACGGDPGTPDGGPGPADSGPPDTGRDGGTASVCASPMAVTLATGTQSVTGDTTGRTAGLVALGAGCGGMATTMAPQQIVALTLPGTASDMVTVTFTLATTGTDPTFDTVVEVRDSCASATGATCFDDGAGGNDYRTVGMFNAPGGSTRYLVVTGYRMPLMGYVNVGPYQIDFETFVNAAPPTFTSGTAMLVDGDVLNVSVMGADPQSAATGLRIAFLDAAGIAIGLDVDMDPATADVTDFAVGFVPPVRGMASFTGTARLAGLGPFPQVATNGQDLRLAIVNAAGLASADATVPLVHATTVPVGATCDATHVCAAGATCTGGTCALTTEVAALCTAATAVTITTPTTATTTATATVDYATGAGVLAGSCAGAGSERILRVTVPAGTFDLLAETPDMGEAGPDTVLYDLTACGDITTETACNDDRSAMPHAIASAIAIQNAAPGDHFLVVDTFAELMAAESTMVTVSLRPVLATGAACDPAGVMNRCAGGACPAGATCP